MEDATSPLADTEVHALHSSATDGEFKIFVGHCGTPSQKAESTLYLTDANGLFGSAVDAIRLMRLALHLPPMLVVGIGYPVGDLVEATARRTKDLSPTDDDKYARLFPERPEMGGAAALLEFIRAELMPWAESNYDVEADDTTFFGHSLGGLFGTYVLLTQPDTFQRYAIGSPSLWWNDGVATAFEQAYADAHDDLEAKVFFGIGADETYDGRKREAVNYPDEIRKMATAWPFDMVEDLQGLVRQLEQRAYPSLDMASAVFPDEFHVTVAPLILSRSLRWLYDAPA